MRISDWSSDVCSSDLEPRTDENLRTQSACSPHGQPEAAGIRRPGGPYRNPGAYADERDLRGPVASPGRHGLPGAGKHAGFLDREEHTSELQSLMRISYAVFCLKKKKQIYNLTPK